ncbi:MAG: glycosyltransferase family 87 protein [Gammaproteobacteria bacterium]
MMYRSPSARMLAQMRNPGMPSWRRVWVFVVLTSPVCVAAVYALMDPAQWDYAFDFRLLWLAGSTWLHGYSPYMPAFDALYAAHFGGGQASWHVFNYPPYFALIALPLATLPYAVATKLWLGVNVVCVALSAAILSSGFAARSLGLQIIVYAAIVVFALTSYPGGYSLYYGQTTLLVLLGACLFVHGYVGKSAVPLCVGLVLLSLKPNLGLLPGLLVAGSVYDFRAWQWQTWALWPVLTTLLFAVVGTGLVIAMTGFDATVPAFAARIAAYSATPPSAVYSLTGMPYLVDTLSSLSMPLWLSLVLAGAVCIVAVRRTTDRTIAVCSVLAAGFFFLPLHTYDLIVAVSLAPLLWTLSVPRAVIGALGMLMIHRCVSLVLEVNPRTWLDDGLLPATLGTLALLAVSLIRHDRDRPQRGVMP